MKKNIIRRCLIGGLIGIAISTVITIIISLALNDGAYHAISPELAADFGSEIRAVTIQAFFSMLYGAAFGGASVVWDTDWSLTKMTVIHLIICSAATFPTAWIMRWMDHSTAGVLRYFGIFVLIYAAIWCSQYVVMKRKIMAMNTKIGQN